MNNILKSVTRLALIILIIVLSGITFYVTVKYIPERFTAVFGLFSSVTMGLVGYVTGKSMKDSMTQQTTQKVDEQKEPLFNMEL